MALFSNMLFDCLMILVVAAVFTQIILPLARRQLTFPILRKFVNRISKPRPVSKPANPESK